MGEKDVMCFFSKLIFGTLTKDYVTCKTMAFLYGEIWEKNNFSVNLETRKFR